MRYAFDDAGRGRAPRDAVLRDVLQPRHLPRGLDRGHAALDAVGPGGAAGPFADDTWELYDTNTDWTQAHDLAAEHAREARRAPGALHRGGAQVQRAAARRPPGRALQLRPRRAADADPGQLAAALRRHGPADRERRCSTSRTSRTPSPPRSTVPDGGADGVIVAQGGAFAGWSLYLKDGKPKYAYNLFGVQHFHVEGDAPIPPGTHQVRMEFAYDGGGLGKGGDGRALRRRREGRRGPRRGHRPDDLLGRRDVRRRLATPARRSATTTPRRAAASPAPSTGCRSTSTTPPRTSTTSSRPRSACRSRWRGSDRRGGRRAPTRAPAAASRKIRTVAPVAGGPYRRSGVAQSAEHSAVNRRVVGSSPTPGVTERPTTIGRSRDPGSARSEIAELGSQSAQPRSCGLRSIARRLAVTRRRATWRADVRGRTPRHRSLCSPMPVWSAATERAATSAHTDRRDHP